MNLGEMYYYLFVELSVPESRDWLFVSSPFPLLIITLGYLYFVLYAGPRYMKDRPPYKLKNFILIYDMIQIVANVWFVKEHLILGWFTKYFLICVPRSSISVDKTKVHNMVWLLIFLKLFDYIETCIFVLRKKQNQVSPLHVYHHVSNMVFLWYFLKYILDERGTIISLVNCTVHVIMYMYYFIAAWSPELQQMILSIKPFITKLQMVQFVAILILMPQLWNPSCDIQGRGAPIIFAGNLFIFLYLFYDFSKKNYTKSPKHRN